MSFSPVNIEILANAKEAIAQFQTVNGELGKMDAATLKAGGSISEMDKANRISTATLLAFGTAAAGVAVLAVKSAMDSQVAYTKLGQALANTGNASAAQRTEVSKLIEEQAKLGFGTVETANAYASLITATGSQTESTKLLSLAEDLARYKHEDLGTAATVLDRATQGSTKAFKELGITLDAHLPKNQAIAAAFDQLQAKIGGQAVAYTKTFSGQMEVLTAQAKSFAEQLGTVLIPILQAVIGFFQRFGPEILIVGGAILTAMAAFKAYQIVMDVFKAGQIVYIALTSGMTAAQTALTFATNGGKDASAAMTAVQAGLNAVMDANPIGLVVVAVTALAAGLVLAWNHSKVFRDILVDVAKAGVEGFGFIIGAVGDLITAFLKFETGPLRLFLEAMSHLPFVGGAAKDALHVINGAISDVGDFFNNAKTSIDGYASSLDALANKKISIPNPFGGGTSIPSASASSGASLGISGSVPGGNTLKSAKSTASNALASVTSAGATDISSSDYKAMQAAANNTRNSFLASISPTVNQTIYVDGSTAPADIAAASVAAIKYGSVSASLAGTSMRGN